MLASSIIILCSHDPVFWFGITIASAIELGVDLAVLRWLRVDPRGLGMAIFGSQIVTWVALVVFMDWMTLHRLTLNGRGLVGIEIMIVLAEVLLLRIASRIPWQDPRQLQLRLQTAFVLSLVGNAANCALFALLAVLTGGML